MSIKSPKNTLRIKNIRNPNKPNMSSLKIAATLFVGILLIFSCILFFRLGSKQTGNNKNKNNNNSNPAHNTTIENTHSTNIITLNENKTNDFKFDNFIQVYQAHIIDKVNNSKHVLKSSMNNIFGMDLPGIDDLNELNVLIHRFSNDSDVKEIKVTNEFCSNTNKEQLKHCIIYPQVVSAYAIAFTCYRFLTNDFIHYELNTDEKKPAEENYIDALIVNYMIVHDSIYQFTLKLVNYFNTTKYLKSKIDVVINSNDKIHLLAKNCLNAFEEVGKELFTENKFKNSIFDGTLIVKDLENVRKFFQLILFQLNLYLFSINKEESGSNIVFSKDFNRIIAMFRNSSVDELVSNESYNKLVKELSSKSGDIYNLFEENEGKMEYKWEIENENFVNVFGEFIVNLIQNGGDF
eukprot:GAHX01002651.1.p1 GENE.GAHX01002651.1~~GAHX01002651.1.p1  ORF type:complete len:407 (+),score=89.62 GAHX01002651.1:179-1399(+)